MRAFTIHHFQIEQTVLFISVVRNEPLQVLRKIELKSFPSLSVVKNEPIGPEENSVE